LHTGGYILILILFIGASLSVALKKLTVAGGLAGIVIGFLLYMGAGWTGVALLAGFFVPAIIATSWRKKVKECIGAAEKKSGRNVGQVLANGGVAALAGALALISPAYASLFHLMIAAAFSSAAADTLSSELGMVYGKNFFNILSFSRDERGLDGVVSYEGFLFGFAGSCIVASIYALGYGWSPAFFWIVFAGTAGNIADSVMGASLERKGVLGNNVVNLLNTIFAAGVCLVLFWFN
jgi:uncharacterized protein (TIGR00297 family)